jgi:hypothetical protein
MLSAAAVTGCADCWQRNCVHPSPGPAESSAGQQSQNGDAGHGRLPDISAVEKAGGWWVSYLQLAGVTGHLGNVGLSLSQNKVRAKIVCSALPGLS